MPFTDTRRLENEVIVLRGGDSEASSQILKGSVVLCLPATLKIEDVHLRMTGHLKVGWVLAFQALQARADLLADGTTSELLRAESPTIE